MAESEIPKSWEGAIRWFIGGTLVFALGFESVVLLWDGKFAASGSSLFAAIALMGVLLNWDWLKSKALRRKPTPSVPAGDNPQRLVPISSAPAYTRMTGQITHNIHTQGGSLVAGPKGKMFPLRFSVASRERAHIVKGGLRYLARVRGKEKGDKILIEEYPDSPTFAVAVGERFLATNDTGYLIQGLIVAIKDDRYDDQDEITFKYRIIPSGQEIIAI